MASLSMHQVLPPPRRRVSVPWRAAGALVAALGLGARGAAAVEGGTADAVSLLQSGPMHPRGTIYYMHIPRTAGTSFTIDASKLLFEAFQVFDPLDMTSKEGCYGWRNTQLGGITMVATMLRNPRDHVLSQYLLCGEGTIAFWTNVQKGKGGFGLWVHEWVKKQRNGGISGDYTGLEGPATKNKDEQNLLFSVMPHRCYNPVNLITHTFTCHHPFIYSKNESSAEQGELALKNMQLTRFVGLQEAYQESICLFASKVMDQLPHFCDCRDELAWNSFHAGGFSSHKKHTKTYHNVTRHGEEVLRDIDEITNLDRVLYKTAVERFISEINLVEAHHQVQILCGNKTDYLNELANLGFKS